MRGIIYLFIGVFSLSFSNQEDEERIYFEDKVECFYPKGVDKPLYIYDGYKGGIVDSLFDGMQHQWYKLAIEESRENNWYKLYYLIQGPSGQFRSFPEYKNFWVHCDQLQLFIPDICCGITVCFFEDHRQDSRVVYTANAYKKLTLLAVWEDWAKVKFTQKGMEKEGWIMRQDQCAAPWTNCTSAGGSCD